MILILEDDPNRHKIFRRLLHLPLICTTVAEAKKEWINRTFKIVFLDHDLGDKKNGDGNEMATFMAQNPKECLVVIHSLNYTAVDSMVAKLREHYHIIRIPFINIDAQFIEGIEANV